MTKYDVTILDDGSKLKEIEHFLKKARVTFKTECNENDFAVHGVEFLGYEIRLTTADERIVDNLKKNYVIGYCVAHNSENKKPYKMCWFHRHNIVQPVRSTENVINVPF